VCVCVCVSLNLFSRVSYLSFLTVSLNRSFSFQFKKGDIFFNYGCFPQTWEDPTFVHPDAEGCRGDNDPLDVCEIGARIVKCGVSLKCNILHLYYHVDCCSPISTETDWFSSHLFHSLFRFFLNPGCPSRQGSRYFDDDR